MGSITEKLSDLEMKYEKAQGELDRAIGSFDSGMERLKRDFGFETIEQAEEEKERLASEELKLKQVLEEEVDLLEKEMSDI